ncbi:MFS transporter [Streptomyces synnematoformans]|uniref:MFS transporter n=1 Tax=Streptomyces synnematoformans TaxID=415721 RepID=A0ABN1ZP00_9ACTN
MDGMPQSPPGTRLPTAAGSRAAAPLWVIVLTACAGQFLVVLDVSVVNVALPSMRADLGMSASGLQWVVNLYTLAFAGLMLLGGRAGDLFGRKRVFLVGLALFTAASLAGGLAQQPWQLLAARAAQGVGAAVLAPSTLTLLTSSVPEGPARVRAIGTWAAVGAGGGAAGALIGGVLTDALSWRWVLLINVPIGAVVLTCAALWLTESRGGQRRRLDIPGAVLVTAGIGAVSYGIVQTESHGWTSAAALLPLAGGLALVAVFLVVEGRTQAPLVPLGLFRLRAVSAANTAMFVTGAAMFSSWYFLSLYMQNVLGYTPIEAGLGFVPHSLTIVAASKLAPRLLARTGAKALAVTGVLMAAAGYLWQSTAGAGGEYVTDIVGPGILMMAGVGFMITPLAHLATSGAPADDAGVVSGVMNTSRTMGGSLGLAVLSTVAATRIGAGSDPEVLASGYSLAFQTGVGILLGCAALMLIALPRPPDAAPEPAKA